MKKITLQWKRVPIGAEIVWERKDGITLYGFKLPIEADPLGFATQGFWVYHPCEIVARKNPYDSALQTRPCEDETVYVFAAEPRIGC